MKKNFNLSSTVAIIVVLSLAVGSIVWGFSGVTNQVCESGATCNYNGGGNDNIGALASPYIYTPLYAYAGLTVDSSFTIVSGGLDITLGDIDMTNGDINIINNVATTTELVSTLGSFTKTQNDSYGAVDGLGLQFDFLIEADGYSSAYDIATSVGRIAWVLDDTATGSQEVSFQIYQKLDNETWVDTIAYEIDSLDHLFNTNQFVIDYDGDISMAPAGSDVNITGDVDISSGALTLDTLTPIADDTMTTADGNVVFLAASSSAYTVTLPAAADGLEVYVVVSGDNTAVTAASTTIASAEGDNIYGTLDVNAADVACSGEDFLVMNSALETVGDFIKLISDGTSWFIIGSQVETAAAFVCTDPS